MLWMLSTAQQTWYSTHISRKTFLISKRNTCCLGGQHNQNLFNSFITYRLTSKVTLCTYTSQQRFMQMKHSRLVLQSLTGAAVLFLLTSSITAARSAEFAAQGRKVDMRHIMWVMCSFDREVPYDGGISTGVRYEYEVFELLTPDVIREVLIIAMHDDLDVDNNDFRIKLSDINFTWHVRSKRWSPTQAVTQQSYALIQDATTCKPSWSIVQ